MGAGGLVTGRLLGPLTPPATGDCTALNWAHAKVAANPAGRPTNGDAPVTLTSAALSAPGCYAWSATLTLRVGALTVLVPAPTTPVLLLTPTVSLTSDQTWSVSPQPFGTHVTISGIYEQPAHVAVQMRYVPSPQTGCRSADFASARLLDTGAAVAVRGDSSGVEVRSGATPKDGCYQPVPYLTVDANPAVRAVGPDDVVDNAVIAGVPIASDTAATPPHLGSSSSTRVWVTLGIIGLLEVGVVVGAMVLARRELGAPPEPGWFDPFDEQVLPPGA
jgi:hypothetical protein